MTEEEYKGRIKKSLEVYEGETKGMIEQVAEHLGIFPNWENRTNSKVMKFLKEREAHGENISIFAIWWWENDWRGQKRQPPTTVQIKELWPQAFDFSKKDEDSELDVRKLI